MRTLYGGWTAWMVLGAVTLALPAPARGSAQGTPPGPVVDLVVRDYVIDPDPTVPITVRLTWTTPDPGGMSGVGFGGAGDGNGDLQTSYDVRWSLQEINGDTWDSVGIYQVTGEPTFATEGTPVEWDAQLEGGSFVDGNVVYFAMKAYVKWGTDGAGGSQFLWSAISNVFVLTVDETPPVAVTNLRVDGASDGWIAISFTETYDPVGEEQVPVTALDLRYATHPLDESTFAGAVSVEVTPAGVGQARLVKVLNLDPVTNYWFAVKSYDNRIGTRNASAISNIAFGDSLSHQSGLDSAAAARCGASAPGLGSGLFAAMLVLGAARRSVGNM